MVLLVAWDHSLAANSDTLVAWDCSLRSMGSCRSVLGGVVECDGVELVELRRMGGELGRRRARPARGIDDDLAGRFEGDEARSVVMRDLDFLGRQCQRHEGLRKQRERDDPDHALNLGQPH